MKSFITVIFFGISFFALSQDCPDNRPKFSYNDDTTIMPGDVKILDILFSFNDCVFYPEFADTITQLGKFLITHPNIRVEISVHSDARGSNQSNLELTSCRAGRISRYLVDMGASNKQFLAIGKGEEEPLCSTGMMEGEQSEELRERHHKINRRVEVKIISIEN